MKEQPEALRLAEQLEAIGLRGPVAAELRRLHQFAEDQIGRATTAEAALQMTKATHALKIAAVEAQRDALLEALKMIAGTAPCIDNLMSDKDIARAAIKSVEGEKT